jgi:hypothetical protein
LCLDKAFSGAPSEAKARVFGYEPHVRQIGEEKKNAAGHKRHKARRWVVERTIGWLNRCRGILIRYEKKAENYRGVVQLACALLWYRRLHRLSVRRVRAQDGVPEVGVHAIDDVEAIVGVVAPNARPEEAHHQI